MTTPPAPARHIVQSDGARIAVTVTGEGPLVLLMPSLGRGAEDFAALAASLAEAGYRAAAVDPRGVAQSAGATANLTLHHYAADLATVIEALGPPAHIVGHAFGNRVVRCLAADRPDLVRTVTLLACGGLVPPEPDARRALRCCFNLDNPAEEHLRNVAAAFFAPGNDPDAWSGGWWPSAAAAETQAGAATPRDDWWHAGSAPLLVVQGLQDRIAPPENGRRLRDAYPERVRLVEIDGAGHALLPEQHARIAEALTGFLAETPDDATR